MTNIGDNEVDIENNQPFQPQQSNDNIDNDQESLIQQYTRALHGELSTEDEFRSDRLIRRCISYSTMSLMVIIPIFILTMYLIRKIPLPDINDIKIDYCNLDEKVKKFCEYFSKAENLYNNITSHN